MVHSKLSDEAEIQEEIRKRCDKPAVTVMLKGLPAETITHGDLEKAVSVLTLQFCTELKAGEVLAIISPPHVLYPAAIAAAFHHKVHVTLVDPNSTESEVLEHLRATGAVAAMVSKEWAERLDSLGTKLRWYRSWRAQKPTFTKRRPHRERPEIHEDTIFLMATSGTTGKPQIVQLGKHNIISSVAGALSRIPLTERDTVVSIAPWHHIMGLLSVNAVLATGAHLVYTDDYANLEKVFKKVRPTILLAVPKLYAAVQKKITERAGKSLATRLLFERLPAGFGRLLRATRFGGRLKLLVSGSAPLTPEIATFFRRLGFGFINGYGMTETSPIITASDAFSTPANSVGTPVLCEVRIEQGEVLVWGPNVMLGYLDRQATVQAITNGWLHTGDLGHFLPDDSLVLTGRKKLMINLPGGKKVNPLELEEILEREPEVEEAFVYPGKGSRGEFVALQVLPIRELRDLDQAELTKLMRGVVARSLKNVSQHKRPAAQNVAVALEPFPKTSSGEKKRNVQR